MERSVRWPVVLLLCCLLVPAAVAAGATAPATARLTVEPVYIPIGMTYSGAAVRVEVGVPAGYEAVVRVTGRAETLEMKRKGKVGGVLWMSVGEATFEAVPAVYFLLTSGPLAETAPASVLGEWQLGYEALASAAGWPAGLSPELIKLKEGEGCFLVGEGLLRRGGSAERLRGSFRFPARALAGEYRVDLIGFHDRRAIHLGSTTIRLEHTGLARVLRSVATAHGLAYGGVAVVVAVLAGLATGFIFRPRKGMGK